MDKKKILTIYILLNMLISLFVIIPMPPVKADPANWYHSGWTYRKLITFNSSLIGGTFNDFPVLISVSDGNLRNQAQTDGDDIMFIDFYDNVTKLNHEIERFDSDTGELIAWLNMTTISPTYNKVWIYYGNATCSSQQNAEDVWNAGFAAVYHMNQASGTVYDSTSNNKDSTAINGNPVYQQSGYIGYGMYFDGVVDSIVLPQVLTSSTSGIIMQAWARPEYGAPASMYIFTQTNAALSQSICLSHNNYAPPSVVVFTNGGYEAGLAGTSWNNWYFIGGGFYSGKQITFINTDRQLSVGSGYACTIPAENANISDRLTGGRAFRGHLDEIRVSKVIREKSWSDLDYNTTSDPAAFLSFGYQEGFDGNTCPLVSNPNPAHLATDIEPGTTISIDLNDLEGDLMSIKWYIQEGSSWSLKQTNSSVTNGTYRYNYWEAITGLTYNWSVNVSDGSTFINSTYKFTTKDDFALKWRYNASIWTSYAASPPVAADVDGDGSDEIFFFACANTAVLPGAKNVIVCLYSQNGTVKWYNEINTGETDLAHAQVSIADLDMDGTYEVIHNGGWNTYAWNAEDGTLFWNSTVNSGWSGHAVVYDERVNHYWVYQATISSYSDNRLYRINGTNGEWDIRTSDDHGQSCNGGSAYADINKDGKFEIVVTGSTGGGDVNGIKVYDLDLNVVTILPWWQQTSHPPALADIDGDGSLEIISPENDGESTNDGKLHVYYANGTLYQYAEPAWCAHDDQNVWQNDSSGAWIVESRRGANYGKYYTKAWNITGNKLEFNFSADNEYSQCLKVDVWPHNGDEYELLFPAAWSDGDGSVYSMDLDFIEEVTYMYAGFPMQGDFDGDGFYELFCINGDGYSAMFDLGTRVRGQGIDNFEEKAGPLRQNAFDHYHTPVVYQARFPSQDPVNGATNISTDFENFEVEILDPRGNTFNWTIEISPDVGSSSGSYASNGTKLCSLSGLSPLTTYTVYVNVSDTLSDGYTRWQIYNFTTGQPGISTKNPTGIEETNATLWGYVDGSDITSYGFEWGTTTSFGNSVSLNEMLLRYLYASGAGVNKIYKYQLSDLSKISESLSYGGTPTAGAADDTYIYLGGSTTNKVRQYWKSNLTFKQESASYGGAIFSIDVDDNYVYAGGLTTNKVYKYQKTDLAKVGETASFGSNIFCVKVDDNYIYVSGASNEKVYQYWKNNMTKKAESINYGGTPSNIVFDDTYVYVGGSTTGRVYQFWKSNMTKKAQSATCGGDNIGALYVDDNYVYAGGSLIIWGTYKVYQFWKSNLTLKATSSSYGDSIASIVSDGTYLYVAGETCKVYKYSLSNLAKVAESADYGNTILYLAIDADMDQFNFSSNIGSLTPGKLYYFRAKTNSENGGTKTFVTKPMDPSNFNAIATSGDTVSITFSRGLGANKTIIQRKTSGYPADPSDGTSVYNGTGLSVTDTGLNEATLYYYRAWSYAAWGSDSQVSDGDPTFALVTRPGPPTNGSASLFNDTTLNLSWDKGASANRTVILKKSTGYPTYSDLINEVGIVYNGTDNETSITVTSGTPAYLRAWSYAAWGSVSSYSSEYLDFVFSKMVITVYNESNPVTPIYARIQITNKNGSITYDTVTEVSTPHQIDLSIDSAPYGDDILFYIRNDSYRSRQVYKDIFINTVYSLSFYLPPIHFSGATEEESESLLYLFTVYNRYSQTLQDAEINVERYINTTGQYESVTILHTDGAGQADTYLIPGAQYFFVVSKSGFITSETYWTPTTLIQTHTFVLDFEIESEPPTINPYDVIMFTASFTLNNITISIDVDDLTGNLTDATIYIYEYTRLIYSIDFNATPFHIDYANNETSPNNNLSDYTIVLSIRDHSEFPKDVYNMTILIQKHKPTGLLLNVDLIFTDELGNPGSGIGVVIGWINIFVMGLGIFIVVSFGRYWAGIGIIALGLSMGLLEIVFGLPGFTGIQLVSFIAYCIIMGALVEIGKQKQGRIGP